MGKLERLCFYGALSIAAFAYGYYRSRMTVNKENPVIKTEYKILDFTHKNVVHPVDQGLEYYLETEGEQNE